MNDLQDLARKALAARHSGDVGPQSQFLRAIAKRVPASPTFRGPTDLFMTTAAPSRNLRILNDGTLSDVGGMSLDEILATGPDNLVTLATRIEALAPIDPDVHEAVEIVLTPWPPKVS